jgi:hypothetical protein
MAPKSATNAKTSLGTALVNLWKFDSEEHDPGVLRSVVVAVGLNLRAFPVTFVPCRAFKTFGGEIVCFPWFLEAKAPAGRGASPGPQECNPRTLRHV